MPKRVVTSGDLSASLQRFLPLGIRLPWLDRLFKTQDDEPRGRSHIRVAACTLAAMLEIPKTKIHRIIHATTGLELAIDCVARLIRSEEDGDKDFLGLVEAAFLHHHLERGLAVLGPVFLPLEFPACATQEIRDVSKTYLKCL